MRATNPALAAVLVALVAVTGLAGPVSTKQAAADFRENIQPILVQYCYDCHGDGNHKGNVAFDELGSDQEMLGNSKLWFAALKNVRAGLMPPDDGPRPTAAEVDRLAGWIKYEAFGLDPADPDPGRVTVRRLNRVEYGNTIRDLMGVEFNAEAAFPPDDSGRGFDNIADVLSISPLLLEKYLQAADTIVKKAVPTVSRVIENRVAAGKDFARKNGSGDGRTLTVMSPATTAYTFAVEHAESYRLVVDLMVNGSFDFSPGHCQVIGRVDGQPLFQEEVVWHERQPLHYEYVQQWSAGQHEVSFEILPLAPVKPPAGTTPAPPADEETPGAAGPGRTPVAQENPPPATAAPATPAAGRPVAALVADVAPAATPPAGDNPVAQVRKRLQGRPPRPPPTLVVRVDTVRVEGPLNTRYWVAPENYVRFFPKSEVPPAPAARAAYAREVLRTFATKAFRRPVEEAKVQQLAEIARATYEQPGKSFEEGIGRAMLAVLASPRFLFLVEQPEKTQAGEPYALIDEYSLASRLSYFLWASMPDQPLFDLAAKGELRRHLPEQLDRMLKDKRSEGLVKNFVGQWLQARDIETVPINAKAVLGVTTGPANVSGPGDFNGPIRKAMHRETELYFDHVMREDRSVLEFIDSDYTFLNEELAKHYGIPGVTGTDLRLVTLPPDSPRGGVLTQGTVLAVTSNPTRTSPVKRGLFILDNFIGTPPPPPPPNIPALEEAKKGFGDREPTLREMLAVHRDSPLCASCHARMDPLGLALENFNAMGMWRDDEAKQPINPAGQLITGESFKNVRELKRVLTHERQTDFYRCLTEKLLTYALGRGLEYYDVATVDRIVDDLRKENGRFSVLLAGVVNSAPFQKERRESDPSPAGMKTAATP